MIIHDGLVRMYQKQQECFYYITVMNEKYQHPAMPEDAREGIIKGMYLFKHADQEKKYTAQLLGCGAILNEVIKAAQVLESNYDVGANIWSVTSFNELYRDGIEVNRWNMLHPHENQKKAYATECLDDTESPVIAATDYVKLYADQIRSLVPASYRVLGTDGYGRSDTREKLRDYFEVDHRYITVATLYELAQQGKINQTVVVNAIDEFNIDPERINPLFG